MPTLHDFPALKVRFETLMAEKETIRAQSAPLWEQYNALQAQADPVLVRMRELAKQIHAIERPRLAEIDRDLAEIARQVGGRSTSDRVIMQR